MFHLILVRYTSVGGDTISNEQFVGVRLKQFTWIEDTLPLIIKDDDKRSEYKRKITFEISTK